MNPSFFFAELKRRRVFRVAAAYAVVAFVVAQIADIFLPGLGLPEWSLRLVLALLILGFPIALVLAWAFDITPEGVVRTGEAPPAPAAAPSPGAEQPGATTPSSATVPLGGRAAGWLGVGILVGLVAVGAYSGVQGRRGPAPAEGVSLTAVAVFPFSVRGSPENEYLGEGMVDLLSAKLDGAGALRAVDPRALLSYLARDGGSAADPEKGRAVAEHFGAGLYILGNILEVGGRLQLSASLYSQERGSSPVASARVEGEAERIWELVDRLAAQLLAEQLGRGERLTRLAATTTESFPALRAYLEGESAFRVGNFPAAIDAYQRAVAADSGFALAHYRLAVSASWAWDELLAGTAIERAVRHADRLSERDRRLVTAFQMYEQGRAAEAEPIYRSLVTTYPDDVEAWYQLGEVLVHYNAFRGRSWQEAWEPFARAVELEPNHEHSLSHLLAGALGAGRQADAEALLDAMQAGGPFHTFFGAIVGLFGDETARSRALTVLANAPTPDIQVMIWVALDAPGHHPRARAVAQLLTDRSRPAPERAAGHLFLAQIELAQGRPRAAAEELRRAERLDPAAALEMRALLALVPFVLPSRPAFEALRAELEHWNASAPVSDGTPVPVREVRPHLRLYLLGLLSARLGQDASARRYAAELERSSGPAAVGTLIPDLALAVRAEAAHARGDAAGALALLERARLEIPVGVATGSPFFFQDRVRGELLPRGRLLLSLVVADTLERIVVRERDGRMRELLEGFDARLAGSGHLLFVRREGNQRVLMAAPLNPRSATLRGEPITLQCDAPAVLSTPAAATAAGDVLHLAALDRTDRRIVLLDRRGFEREVAGPERPWVDVLPSPDGSLLAASSWQPGGRRIWTISTTTLAATPVTRGGDSFRPRWMPDSRHLVFNNIGQQSVNGGSMLRVPADGSALPDAISPAHHSYVLDVSVDGSYLLFRTFGGIRVLPLHPDSAARPLLPVPMQELDAFLSPDMQWVAFGTAAAGHVETRIGRFLEPASAVPIARTEAIGIGWSRGGRFFYRMGNEVWEVPVDARGPA